MAFCSRDCRLAADVVVTAFLHSLRSIRRPSVCTPFPSSIYSKDPLTLDNDFSSALCDSLLILRLLYMHPSKIPLREHNNNINNNDNNNNDNLVSLPASNQSTCWACGRAINSSLSKTPPLPTCSVVKNTSQASDPINNPEGCSSQESTSQVTPRMATVPRQQSDLGSCSTSHIGNMPAHSLSLSDLPSSCGESHDSIHGSSTAARLLRWLLSGRRTVAAEGTRRAMASCQRVVHPHAAEFLGSVKNAPQHCFRVKAPDGVGDASFWEGTEERDTGTVDPSHRCSFMAFHGTSSENVHSILRCGLLKLSGTGLQQNGSMYGAGIYLSTDPGVALSFCKQGDRMASLPHLAMLRQRSIPTDEAHTPHSAAEFLEETLERHSALGPDPGFLLVCQVFYEDGVLRGPVSASHAPSCTVCGKALGRLASADSEQWRKAVEGMQQGLSPKETERESLGSYVVVDSPNLVLLRYVLVYSRGGQKASHPGALSEVTEANAEMHAGGRSVRRRASSPQQQMRTSYDPCSVMLLVYVVVLLAIAAKQSPWVTYWFDWIRLLWARPDEDEIW